MLLPNSYIIYKEDSMHSENSIFLSNYDNHNIYFAPDNTIIYSVSIINVETNLYFLLDHEIKPSSSKKIIPMINLQF